MLEEETLEIDFSHISDGICYFFPRSLFECIVLETNRYANEKILEEKNEKTKFALTKLWKDGVTIQEMKIWMGLHFLRGIVKLPKLHDYCIGGNHLSSNFQFFKVL